MAILPIITAPDPRLKQQSEPVGAVDDGIRRLVDDMFDTMYAAPGIGLAAIQVGEAKSVIVIDLGEDATVAENGAEGPLVLIDPEIVDRSDTFATYNEGCLSVPEEYADVARPDRVTVRHLDRDGTPVELDARGLLATCIQHEMDHLKGVLFIDRLSGLKRNMILRRLNKARRLATAG